MTSRRSHRADPPRRVPPPSGSAPVPNGGGHAIIGSSTVTGSRRRPERVDGCDRRHGLLQEHGGLRRLRLGQRSASPAQPPRGPSSRRRIDDRAGPLSDERRRTVPPDPRGGDPTLWPRVSTRLAQRQPGDVEAHHLDVVHRLGRPTTLPVQPGGGGMGRPEVEAKCSRWRLVGRAAITHGASAPGVGGSSRLAAARRGCGSGLLLRARLPSQFQFREDGEGRGTYFDGGSSIVRATTGGRGPGRSVRHACGSARDPRYERPLPVGPGGRAGPRDRGRAARRAGRTWHGLQRRLRGRARPGCVRREVLEHDVYDLTDPGDRAARRGTDRGPGHREQPVTS